MLQADAIRMIPSVTLITEHELGIVVGISTDLTVLAVEALPGIGPHCQHQLPRELQTLRVTWTSSRSQLETRTLELETQLETKLETRTRVSDCDAPDW